MSAQRNGHTGEPLVPAPALLDGLRVLEYGESAASAFAARMLGDLGATVTKLEPPGGSAQRREGYTPPGGDSSALFAYTSAGKRSVTLDDATAEGRETLLRLIADCDVLVDSHRGSHWQELGIDFEALPGSGRCALAVSITPFGRFGPHAEWAANHLTAHHAGGEAYFFHGGIGYDRYPDGPPLRVPASIAELDAGSAAVVGMLGWLAGWPDAEREPTFLDLSWQEAAMSLCRQDIVKWPNDRYLDTRALREVAVLGLVECKDGWAEVLPAQQHMWERFVEASGNPEWATELGETADHRIAHTEELNQLFEPWLRERTRTEIFDALREFDVPGGPVRLMGDLLTCEQLRLREFLQTVSLPDGTTAEVPAQPYIVREARGPAWRPGPANGAAAAATPSAGAHNEEALRNLPAAPAVSAAPSIRATADPQRPLDWLRGTRVLDLTWYQAGPYANMILCAFGAEILKVESHRRIDPFRHSRRHQSVSLADRKTDDWIDKGYRFNEDNMGKRSVAMDISQERGRDFLRRLVADADVLIEGFRPGTIDRLGLGFDRLIEVNPRLVMVSLSANGATPPDGHMSGYAAVFGATSGLSGLSGYDRSVPAEYRGPLDQRVGTAVAMATLAGLHARDRSDSAIHVDVAAQEAGAALVGDQLVEWQLRGCVAEPLGNRHEQLAPHNVYQCLPIEGEQAYLVIAVETDEQWLRLAEHLGDWRLDPRWDARARKAQEQTIDEAIADWTRGRERDELIEELQGLGVAAAPSATARDLYLDEHVRARGLWSGVEHPRMGQLEVIALPWLINGSRITTEAAPTLGQHNEYVYGDLLGVSAEQLSQLVAEGIAH